jgi:hypothetical protein
MTAPTPRDLLSDRLLEGLGETAQGAAGLTEVGGNISRLADIGYLDIALPAEFGGLGCTLRQAACGQRRLARHDPRTALAVSAHLYWTGAAADAYRAGDESVRWILAEAEHGALFAGGHAGGQAGSGADLRFADPRSRCESTGDGGYRFHDAGVMSSVTPGWDWLAVHGVHHEVQAQSVIAFAGRGTRCTPAFRVARVEPAGNPADIFATSALTWGHSLLASVWYSDVRRAFNAAVAASAGRAAGQGHPLDGWAVAEAGLRLDTMKDKIAEISHPWALVPPLAPDLGGQHLISIYSMRHEIDEGAARVRELISQFGGSPAIAAH